MTSIYGEIGMRIKTAREQCEMTQKQLADTINLKRTSVTNIEAGRQRFDIETLYGIAAALGTSIYELLPSDITTEDLTRIHELKAIADQIKELRQRAIDIRGGGH
jgi:transcriptional regulator with XRE-family HTH domain